MGFPHAPPPRLCALTEPACGLRIAEDADVLAGFEHDLEVAPVHGLLRPPAVDDTPLLADDRHALPVHERR
jgi:hypothetical protein